jgi:hypothetical protein
MLMPKLDSTCLGRCAKTEKSDAKHERAGWMGKRNKRFSGVTRGGDDESRERDIVCKAQLRRRDGYTQESVRRVVPAAADMSGTGCIWRCGLRLMATEAIGRVYLYSRDRRRPDLTSNLEQKRRYRSECGNSHRPLNHRTKAHVQISNTLSSLDFTVWRRLALNERHVFRRTGCDPRVRESILMALAGGLHCPPGN